MVEDVVFDTSAFFTLTDNEPGVEDVVAYLGEAIAGRMRLYASFVSLTEVRYITAQELGEQVAEDRLADLSLLPIQWLHSDAELCSEAATLKAVHRISFADAFVAAAARRFDATLVHKDPEFQSLAGVVRQHMLPAKSSHASP